MALDLSLSNKQTQFKKLIIDDPQVVEALIGGSAGGAKTMSMCIAMVLAMRMYPGIQFALGRKTLQGLTRSTVATLIGKVHPMVGISQNDFRYDQKSGCISYNDGSKITLLALDYEPSDPDFARLGSAEFDWAFIDEAGEISKQAKDVLRSRLGRGVATQKYEIPPKIILSCIPTGGLVQTDSGYKTVESVTSSDKLLCDDGTFSKIKHFFHRTVDEDIYKIKCANNALPLELTGNHPVLVSTPKKWKETFYLDGKQQQNYRLEQNFSFRPASEVREGDWLRMPITMTKMDCPYEWKDLGKAKMMCPFDVPDFWWFVGYWLGDGWSTHGQISLSCDDKYPIIKARLCNVIKAIGRTPNIAQNPNGSSTISFHSNQLEDFLHTQFGKGADKKHIPYWAQNHQNNLDVVDGFLDSDGCVTQHGNTVEFVSVNYVLLCGIQQILLKHGIVSSSKHRSMAGKVNICGRTVTQRDRYHLSFSYRDIREFSKHTSSTKMATFYRPRIVKYERRRRTNCYIEDGYVLFKVKKISTKHYKGSVYNFETMPHNYVAGNFTCHNCNPSTNFLRTEYYQPYKSLGAGEFQKWQIGNVVVKGKKYPAYRAFLRMSVKDNPFIDKNYYETLKQLPDRERKRLLDGNWDYADNDRMLFSGELIEDCTINQMPEMDMVERNDYLMGVDVADVGTDSSVISIVQNNILIKQIKINLRDAGIGKDSRIDVGDYLSEKVIYHAKHLGFSERDAKRITIETNGVGASLRDALRRKRWFVTEYTADVNSRSRMFYSLHELMVDGKVSIYANGQLDYDELRRQMTAHEYELDNDKVKITNKKNLRKQLGCSPDMADSFAIAMYTRGDAILRDPPKTIDYFTKVRL